jgi:hypothetical protein
MSVVGTIVSNIKIKESRNKMLQIKVVHNDKSEKTVTFSETARKSVLAKYNQLVSQGDILDFQIV